MNDTLLTEKEWEHKYNPWQDENDGEANVTYDPWDSYERDCLENHIDSYLIDHPNHKPYNFVWSIVEGDSGKQVLLNGYHKVNLLAYIVCYDPWGTGNEKEDNKIYIEVKYQD